MPTNKSAGNVFMPHQTQAEAEDQALAKWAAMQIKSVNLRVIGRHAVSDAVDKMKPAEQERARFWLNHFRKMAKVAK